MAWWGWMLLGLGLLGLELVMAGGFIFLFFSVSALLVGALVGLGLAEPPWLQWLLFSLLSVMTLFALRKPLKARFSTETGKAVDPVVGEVAVANEEFASGATGQVEFRGSPWTAKNAGDVPIAKGQRCQVERIQGLTLWVRPE